MSNKKNKLAKPKPGPPTQRYLDIEQIRDNIVLLKDGTMRAVILVSSINFALKSADEQQATIQSYMQFLNGLEYPIQIVIQSRKMNIDKYILALKEQEKQTKNQLLKAQVREYRSFINDLVDLGEIMQKRFYVVVPYDPVADKKRGFMQNLSAALSPAKLIKLSNKQSKERKDALMQRVRIVQSGLTGMSLMNVQLDTQGLIELYYTVYNPDVFDTQRLKDINDLQIDQQF